MCLCYELNYHQFISCHYHLFPKFTLPPNSQYPECSCIGDGAFEEVTKAK